MLLVPTYNEFVLSYLITAPYRHLRSFKKDCNVISRQFNLFAERLLILAPLLVNSVFPQLNSLKIFGWELKVIEI